jgi:uncharacterized membrane protein YhaH (DUF805 family)
MPSQKLKRICLGIVGLLSAVVVFWFFRNISSGLVSWHDAGRNWNQEFLVWIASVFCYLAMAFILIIGLYVIAKILIEIFK